MLKAPPLNPQAYISGYSKIGQKEGHIICSKVSSKRLYKKKKVKNGVCPVKKVNNDTDNDIIIPRNVEEIRGGAFSMSPLNCELTSKT